VKKFLKSKTFWVNLIALGALVIQIEYGYIVSLEIQAMALVGINLVLRKLTNEGIELKL
jgi:membrane protein CcdC involved in cytochrome C biogenesis